MKHAYIMSSLIATLLMSAAVLAHSADVKKTNGMLVSADGMTVYTFDKDVADNGKSACAGPCTKMWPAVVASDTAPKAPWGSIKRDDGTMQTTYKGKPLYMFSGDKKPGDAAGDNFKDMWHTVKD
jgi:predicted lipoprotein with Yx(FWY)xxD motif